MEINDKQFHTYLFPFANNAQRIYCNKYSIQGIDEVTLKKRRREKQLIHKSKKLVRKITINGVHLPIHETGLLIKIVIVDYYYVGNCLFNAPSK